VKFGFIAKHREIWPVDVQCGALGVSCSGFYAWQRRAPSRRAVTDAAIVQTLRTAFALSDATYGVRRIWDDVRDAGHACGRERVRRLMRYAGLRARPPRRARPSDDGPRPLHQVAPHLLARDFTATAPDQKWVADFTYIWTGEGWLFFAVVLDLFSRRVVGWSMQSTMTAQLVTDALVTAVWRRGGIAAEALLHHSDQGSQYSSETFQRQLAGLGIACSMSRSGNVWDNAVMESFFSTLKIERCHRRRYTSRDEARADIFDYVERFYNPVRRHSTLGNLSPLAFEQTAARTAAMAVA
jgi:putative transposase